MVAGWSNSYGSGDKDIYILTTDSCGNLCQTRIVGDTLDDEAKRIAAPANGPYGLFGNSYSFRPGNRSDCYLVELGSPISSVNFGKATGGNRPDIGNDAVMVSDGYLGVGATRSYGQGANDVYVLKYNSSGTVSWSRTFGGEDHDIGEAVVQTSDGGYAICGSTQSFGAGGSDIYLIKITSTGTVQWNVVYGTDTNDYAYDLKQLSDGGYIVTGYTVNASTFPLPSKRDVFLLRTDQNGSLQWSKAYGGHQAEEGRKVIVDTDGGFVVIGSTKSYGAGSFDVYIIRTDTNGVVTWARTYGGPEPDEGRDIKETEDNGYIATGFTESFGPGQKDVYLIKTDQNGDSGCKQDTGLITWNLGLEEAAGLDTLIGDSTLNGGTLDTVVSIDSIICTTCDSLKCLRSNPDGAYRSSFPLITDNELRAKALHVYPNPAHSKLFINTTGAEARYHLQIFDLAGRLAFDHYGLPGSWVSLDVSRLTSGLYTLVLTSEKSQYISTFIKQ